MDSLTKPFVHILLFGCPNCSKPIAVAHATPEQNLEEIDARSFDAHCGCGWWGQLIGAASRKHWVEPWSKNGSSPVP